MFGDTFPSELSLDAALLPGKLCSHDSASSATSKHQTVLSSPQVSNDHTNRYFDAFFNPASDLRSLSRFDPSNALIFRAKPSSIDQNGIPDPGKLLPCFNTNTSSTITFRHTVANHTPAHT